MKKIKFFEDRKMIIETPMLSNNNYSSIAGIEIYLNEYGTFVISATNHDDGTGYYSLSLKELFNYIDEDTMSDYRERVRDIHHISVDYNGFNYSVVFGKYINGGFFSIPNWNRGGELANYNDIFWNTDLQNRR